MEDQLQSQVPETIRDLRLAQIKIWMLTGDKIDTAHSIGLSCNLITPKMKTFIVSGENGDTVNTLIYEFEHYMNSKDEHHLKSFSLIKSSSIGSMQEKIVRNFNSNSILIRSVNDEDDEENKDEKGKNLKNSIDNFAIVIDSTAISKILADNNELNSFLTIALRAYAVICCRISPLQKSEIVRCVKNSSEEVVSLAIGDGGNDVSMILEANIGVGIHGEEGMRAVQASDFALGEFRFLRRLLLNQGRKNNIRISNMVLYFFYKNFIITIIHYYFAFYNNFSGQTIIDDWFIALYNMIFTALPLAVNAVFEFDLRPSDSIIIDKLLPFLYIQTRDSPKFTVWNFIKTIIRAICEGAIIFFLIINSQQLTILSKDDGYVPDLWYFSMNIYTTIIFVVSLRLLIYTRVITHILIGVMAITSWGAYFVGVMAANQLELFNSMGTTHVAFTSIVFYLNLVLVAGICYVIDFFFHSFSLNIVMGLCEKITHDFNLIKEITKNSMLLNFDANGNEYKKKETSKKKKSSEKVSKSSKSLKYEDFDENNMRTFEDLPFYIGELLDYYIEYEGELNNQYQFQENVDEKNNLSQKRKNHSSPKKVNKSLRGNQNNQGSSSQNIGNFGNNYTKKQSNLLNIMEEDKAYNQEQEGSEYSDKNKKGIIFPIKGDKKYFDSSNLQSQKKLIPVKMNEEKSNNNSPKKDLNIKEMIDNNINTEKNSNNHGKLSNVSNNVNKNFASPYSYEFDAYFNNQSKSLKKDEEDINLKQKSNVIKEEKEIDSEIKINNSNQKLNIKDEESQPIPQEKNNKVLIEKKLTSTGHELVNFDKLNENNDYIADGISSNVQMDDNLSLG